MEGCIGQQHGRPHRTAAEDGRWLVRLWTGAVSRHGRTCFLWKSRWKRIDVRLRAKYSRRYLDMERTGRTCAGRPIGFTASRRRTCMPLSSNYNCTLKASYTGYVVQAIVNNFAPLLFLTFHVFWLFAFIFVCAGASEQAMSQWASAFAESGLKVSKTMGDLAGPCMFSVLMGLSSAHFPLHRPAVPGEAPPCSRFWPWQATWDALPVPRWWVWCQGRQRAA